ncbi:hypothetical protein TVAG_352000 [Trichomonas vaginalis G3]|uniref:Right handed beta helix domain-containing protein n=1 Tax=Trichomonas vaginalis (strain ATCC PRA-98 / G3) TaxID=412133 RepID=A2DZT4_TRIV3|nr:pectin lyase-like family [Trichomonas vaginalis G3]EAY14152.1 hypothetical protein TVAG_352000 [Trichomonas vaginalis G3]KAI5525162.1 pectin lyase-like family [Trichomonas vaginalis G3]|eukprot:XP_001326375.1 hypothetical protein [Trichomonas vaginalis G3]
MTWADLELRLPNYYEPLQYSARDNRNKFTTVVPKLIQNQKDLKKVQENIPFLGIIDCSFDTISDQTTGIVELENTMFKIYNTNFSNIENCYGIYTVDCRDSKIINCSFTNFNQGGALNFIKSNEIFVTNSKFSAITGNDTRTSVAILDNCYYCFFRNCDFTNNDVFASVFQVSKSEKIKFDFCNFRFNTLTCPGCIFFYNSENCLVQNSEFTDNVCFTHSAALFSTGTSITLKHDYFARNQLNLTKEYIPEVTTKLDFWQVAATVTVVPAFLIKSIKCPHNFKNLYFDHNYPINTTKSFRYLLNSIDMICFAQEELESPVESVINVQGVIQTTNNASIDIDFNSMVDQKQIIGNLEKVDYNISESEEFDEIVDHAAQSNMPTIRYKTSTIYSSQTIAYAVGKLSYFAIEQCEFSMCTIGITQQSYDSNVLIFLNLSHHGYFSLTNTRFSENYAYSSLIQAVDCKGFIVNDCKFSYNTAKHSSCALIYNSEIVRIMNCKFDRNDAYVHGAIAIYNSKDAVVKQCTFKKNYGFCGCSSLIFNNTNMSIIDTMFTRNNVDHERWDLNSNLFPNLDDETILKPHENISGVYTANKFSVSLSGYGNSQLYLDNVGFSNSEIENDMNITDLKVESLDVYIEESVKVEKVQNSITDTKKRSCNRNIGINWTNTRVTLSTYYRYNEYYEPFPEIATDYEIIKDGDSYKLNEVSFFTIIDSPENAANVYSWVYDEKPNIPQPTPAMTPSPIIKVVGHGKTIGLAVFGGIIGLTVIILVGATIYFCKRPPEARLHDDPNDPNKKDRKKALLEEKENDEAIVSL